MINESTTLFYLLVWAGNTGLRGMHFDNVLITCVSSGARLNDFGMLGWCANF
jgi:hypothetical protein